MSQSNSGLNRFRFLQESNNFFQTYHNEHREFVPSQRAHEIHTPEIM
jgi:hypothetical protein